MSVYFTEPVLEIQYQIKIEKKIPFSLKKDHFLTGTL